jgi:hypothetical protein
MLKTQKYRTAMQWNKAETNEDYFQIQNDTKVTLNNTALKAPVMTSHLKT